ncbi:MAG: tyrosine-type recombinase/integrase [Oscillospiraceae bacterium]|nr:tyrosine-type recombinase/integrase [Oscillospiraceae bacterium]
MARLTTIINEENLYGGMKYADAAEKFYKHCIVKNLSPLTLEYYRSTLKFFKENYPVEYLSEIDLDYIENVIYQEQQQKARKATTINTHLRGFRVFLYFCMDREYMKPFKFCLMKSDAEPKEAYTTSELKRLLAQPKSNKWSDWRNWALVNYFIATGNRVRTVVNIKISDVDFEAHTVRLRHTKNRKQQIIPITSELEKVLKKYLSLWLHSDDDYLFPNRDLKQWCVRTIQQEIRLYNRSRDVTKSSVHLFRHTFAKNYLLAGGGVAQLQKLLGHKTLEMTLHYANLYGADLAKDYERFNPLEQIIKSNSDELNNPKHLKIE